MTRRLHTRVALAAASLVAMGGLALAPAPVQAGATLITDASGVDYDLACGGGLGLTAPPSNSVHSPGSPGASGPCSVSTYDGSTESSDLQSVQLASSSGDLLATLTADATIPSAGATAQTAVDMPSAEFIGVGLYALFQNTSVETNIPRVACSRTGTGTPVYDVRGSWKDGYHFFLGFVVGWDGTRWVHTAQIGEYDPSPGGGYDYFELGSNDGSGWVSSDPNMQYGQDWSVDITGGSVTVRTHGILSRVDTTNCNNGIYQVRYAGPGDSIVNVKGLSTVNRAITLPVVVPLTALCGASAGLVCPESDTRSVGGFYGTSDVTFGNSRAGLLNTNITGIAFTGGALGASDTLGKGPTCPTPTVGGLLPPNPLFVPNQACHIDDDSVSRGSLTAEWWDTSAGFTF